MDTLSIYLNNITNQLIYQNGKNIPIFCNYRYFWLFINTNNKIATDIYLIKIEFHQVYTHFRYSLINKLHKLLTQASHNIEHKTIKIIIKFCHYYQIKNKVPQRFKFTLKKDINFNYKIIINIMYLNKKSILHTIDTIIAFQISQFSDSMSVKNIWETLYQC